MKKIIYLFLFSITFQQIRAQVGINTDNPNASSALDIVSNNKGLLVPRMTSSGRGLIMSPAEGLLVYQTDGDKGFYSYSGGEWVHLSSQLQKITEGGKTGYRLLGANPNAHGDIGDRAVDLSTSQFNSTSNGAVGSNSFAAGLNTSATANGSIALGIGSSAIAEYSIAMGFNSRADYNSSVAIGALNKANNYYSIAMGNNNEASGESAFVAGELSTAQGYSSTSFGSENLAFGHYSVALGKNIKAVNYLETVVGRFNDVTGSPFSSVWEPTARLFSVGNGSSEESRANAFTILKNADIKTKGNIEVEGSKFIEFGTNISGKEANAGRLGYQTFSNGTFKALDVVGAGSASNARNVKVWDNLYVNTEAFKPVAGGFVGTSDIRTKKNIQNYSAGLKEILEIRPVTFEFNGKANTHNDGKTYVGVIAQEIEKILPGTVINASSEDIQDLKKYDGSELTYTLINAVKELSKQLKVLQAENEALKLSFTQLNNIEMYELKSQIVEIKKDLHDTKRNND